MDVNTADAATQPLSPLEIVQSLANSLGTDDPDYEKAVVLSVLLWPELLKKPPQAPVPATTAIKRSRVHNINTERLINRRQYLVEQLTTNVSQFDQRIDFAVRAAELKAIENELVDRGVLSTEKRYTKNYDRNSRYTKNTRIP